MIFIECKNWTSKIPVDEIGKFNNKMIKRKGSAKLGIFIAINGFTEKYNDEIKHLVRDGYVIAIIEGKDFVEFFDKSSSNITDFLKSKIIDSLL